MEVTCWDVARLAKYWSILGLFRGVRAWVWVGGGYGRGGGVELYCRVGGKEGGCNAEVGGGGTSIAGYRVGGGMWERWEGETIMIAL